ncbi:MAG TPA: FHA domain-containing protein [Thermoanaerobaculia bacterium]|jgi:pSer/pThr/pTyr-binding forkhead associated (FHA) protein
MAFVIQRVTGRQISLTEIRTSVLRIGRGTNAELRSDNPAVALEHAVIESDSAGYSITDRGSITGTYVNGRPVETARLAKGDVIEVGDLRVEVQLAEATKPLFLRIVARPKARPGVPLESAIDDDEPAAAPVSGKSVRARAVDYAGSFRLTRPYLTKASLIALGLIVTLAVVGEVTKPEKQTAFMPGGVSSAHARARDAKGQPIANRCEACHTAWNSVDDTRCMTCHTRAEHSLTERGTPACMSCHAEHRAAPKLSLMDDTRCVVCHSDLSAHLKVGAPARSSDGHYDFAAIRKVTAFGAGHPELVAPSDPNNVRFNHALHLKQGGIFNASGRRETLECSGCHKLVVARGKADPEPQNFESHCQRCHKLTFDARFPDAEVPHGGDPGIVYGYVVNIYSGNRDIIGKSPDEVRRLLTRRAAVSADERAVLNAVQVVKVKCAKCHELRRETGQRLVVDKPVIRTNWFAGARFTHTAHKDVGCETCHDGARRSSKTSDVLMPTRDDCVACHGPRTATSAPGATAAASNCVTCHEYHVRSKPLIAAAASSLAGTSPGGSGGNARMIQSILLIAIAVLIVVVLVPLGVVLYQRLKPRPEEKPRAAAPRAAAPPPPAQAAAAPASAPQAPQPPAPGVPPTRPVSQADIAAAAAPPPPPPPPSDDATRIGSIADMQGGGRQGATEFVEWYGMLLCTSGSLEGQRFVVEQDGIYIGRDAALSQVVINDGRISKRHVRIVPRGGKVWAVDQGSTNGTFLGGQRITEVQLKRGDTLVLADNAAAFLYQI